MDGEALAHQEAAIIAAGHAGQGEKFVHLVDNIISQCEFQPRGLFRGGDSRSVIQPISRVERGLCDVVMCMLDHLELGGPFKRKRVGLAYQSNSRITAR